MAKRALKPSSLPVASVSPRDQAKPPSALATMHKSLRKLQGLIAAARRLISPAIFADCTGPSIKTIMIPVPNDGWAPAMRCGEFAMVDVTNRDLEDGAFVVRRSGTAKHMDIVRISVWQETGSMRIIRDPGEDPNSVYWKIMYAAQSALNIDGTVTSDDFLRHFHMCDGPLADKHLREEIVGRVIGVLGDEGRALNWRDHR